MDNYLKLQIPALSENESFARSAVAAFAVPLSPTVEELGDIKTAVSEAVTNAVVHAYTSRTLKNEVHIEAEITGRQLTITVTDFGIGISDVKKALEPFYSSKPESERSGMGFTVMQSFMDELTVTSQTGNGTTVIMKKTIGASNA